MTGEPTVNDGETSAPREPEVYINPGSEAQNQILNLPAGVPIDMLNMIRYKDKAEYPADSEFSAKGWSGERAYAEYGARIGPIAERLNSSLSYSGVPQLTVIGPDGEKWDAIFVVRYPDVEKFFALISNPEYLKHVVHRNAAVADSRLYQLAVTTPPEPTE